MYNIHHKNNIQIERRITDLCKSMPYYIKGFASFLEAKSPSTRYVYLCSIIQYMQYVNQNNEAYSQIDVYHMPVWIFKDLTSESMKDYLDSMSVKDRVDGTETVISDDYYNRILAAFKAFFCYLNNKEHISYECPVIGTIWKKELRFQKELLSRAAVGDLIEGIKRNDTYLYVSKSPEGEKTSALLPIGGEAALRKQRTITRNVLIICLLAYEGLTVSETAGLDIDSFDFNTRTILVLHRDQTFSRIPFCKETAEAFTAYLHAPAIPEELLSRQKDPARQDFLAFCDKHLTDPHARTCAIQIFHKQDDDFLNDIETCCRYLRNSGRNSFFPTPDNRALLLSVRSRRISIRMIEQMVLEMTKTYLPELSQERNIGPNMLRASALYRDPDPADSPLPAEDPDFD